MIEAPEYATCCERCGAAIDDGARRVILCDRGTGRDRAFRGRRSERTVCGVCAEALWEALTERLESRGTRPSVLAGG